MKKTIVCMLAAASFTGSIAHADTTKAERAKVGASIQTCEARASILGGAKWGGLVMSTTGSVTSFLVYSANAMGNTTGIVSPTHSRLIIGGAVSAIAGAAALQYLSFHVEDVRELSRLAAELGYNADGLTTQAFLTRCLKSNTEEACTKTLETLRAEAKAGTMCSWKMITGHM